MRLQANHALRLAWLGRAHLMVARPESALDLARRALNLAEERQERGQQAYAQYLLGDIAANAGDSSLQAAETAYREALGLAVPLAMRPLIAHCHRGLAGVSGRTGRSGEASTANRM